MIELVADALKRTDDIALIVHTSPDGDGLGSALALHIALKKLGKRVVTVCDNPLPHSYRFLPLAGELKLPDGIHAKTAVAVDCADMGRLGKSGAVFASAHITFNIDHHITNTRYAQYNAVFEASATGECMLDLLRALDIELDVDMATCLFVAISTDTGHFSYGNTSGDCLRATARLVEAGIDVMDLTSKLYRMRTLGHTRLIGKAIANMRLYEGGRLVISCLARRDFEESGAKQEDTEGLIEHLRNMENVEIAAILRECGDEIFVSMRSNRKANVGMIAQSFDGGGHRRAAGCTLRVPLHDAEAAVREALIAALREEI